MDLLLSHLADHGFKFGLIPLDHLAHAKEAHDAGHRQERAEHDGDSSVLVDMTDGFASRAGAVNISRMVRIEDGKSR